MTLQKRLAFARKIAARTLLRFVKDNSRGEARQKLFAEPKRYTKALERRKRS